MSSSRASSGFRWIWGSASTAVRDWWNWGARERMEYDFVGSNRESGCARTDAQATIRHTAASAAGCRAKPKDPVSTRSEDAENHNRARRREVSRVRQVRRAFPLDSQAGPRSSSRS
jgi:hypothetical protein